jgi:hypothetical protein
LRSALHLGYTRRDMRILACCLVLAACAHKAPVDDDFSSLSGMDEKSDSFSYRMKILGSLNYGDSSSTLRYTKSPRYRAYKFAGYEGDRVDVWVRSNDGDAVTWVLDNNFNVVASNDDADDNTLDSHIVTTLAANDSATHYIVYRDYSTSTAHFSVDLAIQPYDTSCTADADCEAVDRGGCCPDGTAFAVNTSSTADYAAAVACTTTPRPYCPQHIINETRVAECNTGVGHCHMIAVEDIHCGGFIANAHACPAGYACHVSGVPDVGGNCVAQP